MKNALTTLFFAILGIVGIQWASAQDQYGLRIGFTDLHSNNYYDTVPVIFRNTDSSQSNPYTSAHSDQSDGSYEDTGSISSQYTDSTITIYYFACGQWFKIDTFFHYMQGTSNPARYWLQLFIQVPCYSPCNAEFTISYPNDSTIINRYYYAKYQSTSTKHLWDFGDGSTGEGFIVWHTHDSVGDFTVRHIAWDTLANCSDTASMLIYAYPDCNPNFALSNLKYGKFGITPVQPFYSGLIRTWKMGDGSVFNYDSTFTHHYRIGPPNLIYLTQVVEYPGVCKDSLTVQVKHFQGYGNIQSYSIQFKTLTIHPDNNIDTFVYSFGDGDTIVATGSVTHHYTQAANFTVSVWDINQFQYPKYLAISSNQGCTNVFSFTIDSLFRAKFESNLGSSYTYRHIIGMDTVHGSPAFYIFNQGGYYSILHQVLDMNGAVVCQTSSYIQLTSCGYDVRYVSNQIGGAITMNGQLAVNYDSMRVYLILHNSGNSTLTAIDSLTLTDADSAVYLFTEICDTAATYLVKAALLPGSSLYSNYLPTYANQSGSWSGARSLRPGQYGNIQMIQGTNPGGPGFIGGYISQGANKKFKPLEDIQVNLFDVNDTPMAFDLSDANGYYEFPSLPYGTYRVTVEIMGKPSDSYMITLSATNEKAEAQDFEVNSTYVSTINTAIHLPQLAGRIYPNPAKDQLMIEWSEQPEALVTLRFYSVHGQLVAEYELDPKTEATSTINTKELPRGMYMLQIGSGIGQSVHRIQLD